MDLYIFSYIEVLCLLFFIKKECISVDVLLIEKYIDNIIIFFVCYYDISI